MAKHPIKLPPAGTLKSRVIGSNRLTPGQQLTRSITSLSKQVGVAKTPSPNPGPARKIPSSPPGTPGRGRDDAQASKSRGARSRTTLRASDASLTRKVNPSQTSTDRMTARRTTNPNAASMTLGKGQASKGLSVSGAGRPPAPTPAGVESDFKKGGARPTSRGQGTKGLNVGGMGRPGGGGMRLFSPLGGPGGKDKFRQGRLR